MCIWCDKAKKSSGYNHFLQEMLKEDTQRIENSKIIGSKLETTQLQVYSSMQYPTQFIQPMFDVRAAYAVPNNYYQNLFINEERAGVSFSHGSMRSLFFVGSRLILFSKNVQHSEGLDFFTSFILLHLEKSEFSFDWQGEDLAIHAEIEKPMKNLLTEKIEKKKITFNFIHQNVKNHIVSREQVVSSTQLKNIYGHYLGVEKKMASVDIEGYAITVPHFAPHPYMLQLHSDFGFVSNREIQEHVLDYFISHLI